MNQNRKNPILKGKLTKISAALFALVQTPGLLSDISMTAQVFTESAQQPITYLSLVAAAGVIWGGLRRAINYQLPTLPRIVFQRATPVDEQTFQGMTRDEIETAIRFFRQNFPAGNGGNDLSRGNGFAQSSKLHGFASPFERDDA
jgi:hypothetical protein